MTDVPTLRTHTIPMGPETFEVNDVNRDLTLSYSVCKTWCRPVKTHTHIRTLSVRLLILSNFFLRFRIFPRFTIRRSSSVGRTVWFPQPVLDSGSYIENWCRDIFLVDPLKTFCDFGPGVSKTELTSPHLRPKNKTCKVH